MKRDPEPPPVQGALEMQINTVLDVLLVDPNILAKADPADVKILEDYRKDGGDDNQALQACMRIQRQVEKAPE